MNGNSRPKAATQTSAKMSSEIVTPATDLSPLSTYRTPYVCEPQAKSQRLEWVARFIRAARQAGEVPPFGSFAWIRLPDSDPRKVGAVCIAAEAWACSTDPATIRRDLEDEMHARRQAEELLDRDEWDRATSRIRKINSAPSWASRQQRVVSGAS